MSRASSLIRHVLVAATLAQSACIKDSGDDVASRDKRGTVEIFSWWTGGGEEAALRALTKVFTDRHPGLSVINSVQTSDATARAVLKARLARTDPPHSFQVLNGQRVKQLLKGNTPTLSPLDEIYDRNGWRTAFVSKLVGLASDADGHIYCVPINMQRENNLYFDIKTFTELGLAVPQSLSEFHAVAAKLRAAGKVPLALGADQDSAWVVRILFQSVMIAVTGQQYYEDFFAIKPGLDWGPFRSALEEFLRFIDETDKTDSDYANWSIAAQQLAERRAAMLIHGDWVVGELTGRQKTPGVDFGEVRAPGTAGVFVGSSDCFPLPVGLSSSKQADAIRLLETIGSAEGQDAFNPLKGSIPARIDVDKTRYDVLARQRMDDAQRDSIVGALPVLLDEAAEKVVQTAIATLRSDYWAAKSIGAPDAAKASIEGAVRTLWIQFAGHTE